MTSKREKQPHVWVVEYRLRGQPWRFDSAYSNQKEAIKRMREFVYREYVRIRKYVRSTP